VITCEEGRILSTPLALLFTERNIVRGVAVQAACEATSYR